MLFLLIYDVEKCEIVIVKLALIMNNISKSFCYSHLNMEDITVSMQITRTQKEFVNILK